MKPKGQLFELNMASGHHLAPRAVPSGPAENNNFTMPEIRGGTSSASLIKYMDKIPGTNQTKRELGR